MITMAALLLWTISVLLVLMIVRWRRRTFSYFEDLGIPGPSPNLIWGNLWEYHEKELFRALGKWCKKYGDIFGFYNGDVPVLVVKDLDFLEYVFIRNSSNFTDRGVTMVTDETHPFVRHSIVHAKDPPWRSMRSCLSSCFTTSKLKQMMGHITEVSDVFISVLGEHADNGEEVCMTERFQALAMDYIGRAAFGIDTSFQHDPKNPFFIAARKAVTDIMTGPFHMLGHCTTSLGKLATPLLWLSWMIATNPLRNFAEHAEKVIRLRKHNPELRRNDLLQCLIDAEYEELPAAPKTTTEETADTAPKAEARRLDGIAAEGVRKTRTLRSEEVIMNTTVLFLAGYETTEVALCYVTYALAKYPDVQENVRKEMQEAIAVSGALDYEAVTQKLKYMGQVVNEALRLWPPLLTFTTRQASEDFEYQGVRYKAGTSIMASPLHIHTDARFFLDPMKFDPDRFSTENGGSFPKHAYQPFGLGPRNCIGSRLALIEITYTIAKMTQHYRWELGPSQKGDMPLKQYAMVSAPARGPWIVFHRVRE